MAIPAAGLLLAAALAGNPLIEAFARCDSWYQAPTQPGLTVVACDQAQLDHFIESELTHPGPGGAALRGPAGRVSGEVPAVYFDERPGRLERVTVTGRGTATGLYVSWLGWDGSLREATFSDVVLPTAQPRHLARAGGALRLLGRDGPVLARAALRTTRLGPFERVPLPRNVRVRPERRGRATVTWRARRGLGYTVSAAAQRDLKIRQGVSVHPARSGSVSVRIRLRPSHRWVAVRAFSDSAMSPAVLRKIIRR
jgi:hypothetical protein